MFPTHSKDGRMRNRLFLQLMGVNILASLIQPCNQLIDSILTGKYLGQDALAVCALFLPAISLVMALSAFFSVGTQITCSHLLGKGCFDEIRSLLSTSFLSSSVFSCLLTLALLVFPAQAALLLGADAASGQLQQTISYLQGYAPGIPAVFLTNIMLSLLHLEGQKKLAVILSAVNLSVNAAGDLLNLFCFRQGLSGMAFATSAANLSVFLILMFYFLFSSRMFRFSLTGFQVSQFRKILHSGLPSLTYYGSLVVRSAFLNMLILTRMDSVVLAVMAVVSSFTNLVDAAIGGTGDAMLLLGGVLYGERNLKGHRQLLKTALLAGGLLLLMVTAVSCLASVPVARLFSERPDGTFVSAAARAVRLTSLCFVPDVLACVLKKNIQAVGRASYTSVSNVLCNVVYVCVSALILGTLIGSDGIFLSFTVCYVLILLTHLGFARHLAERTGWKGPDRLLFLPEDYEITDDDIWSCTVKDLPGCIRASEKVQDLCLSRGRSARVSHHLALFTEEITKNVVTHGFRKGRENLILLTLLFHREKIRLIILDNCARFDPKRYYDLLKGDEDPAGGTGIRLTIGLADQVTYTSSFNLNNLMIEVYLNPEKTSPEPQPKDPSELGCGTAESGEAGQCRG